MGSSLPQHKVHKVFSLEGRSFVVCMLMVKVLSIDETLGRSIKQTTLQRGNGRTKREDRKFGPQEQNLK
jgi:hypothetical protein